MTLANITK